jgi:hypothetical protein
MVEEQIVTAHRKDNRLDWILNPPPHLQAKYD